MVSNSHLRYCSLPAEIRQQITIYVLWDQVEAPKSLSLSSRDIDVLYEFRSLMLVSHTTASDIRSAIYLTYHESLTELRSLMLEYGRIEHQAGNMMTFWVSNIHRLPMFTLVEKKLDEVKSANGRKVLAAAWRWCVFDNVLQFGGAKVKDHARRNWFLWMRDRIDMAIGRRAEQWVKIGARNSEPKPLIWSAICSAVRKTVCNYKFLNY